MVAIARYNPPAGVEGPMALRMALLCRATRVMIIAMSVRLSARQIEMYEVLISMNRVSPKNVDDCPTYVWMCVIPTPARVVSSEDIIIGA